MRAREIRALKAITTDALNTARAAPSDAAYLAALDALNSARAHRRGIYSAGTSRRAG